MSSPLAFFGDISTILQLVWSLRKILSDVGGATQEVQTIISDIDAFTNGLQAVKAALDDTTVSPAIHYELSAALCECEVMLKTTKSRVEKFNTSIIRSKNTSILTEYWERGAWVILGGKDEVEALRRRLSARLSIIETLVGLSQR